MRNMLSPGVRYMLLASFVFSIMNVCVKHISHIPAVEIVLFRAGISLAMSYWSLKRQAIPIWGTNTKVLLLRGTFGTLALVLTIWTYHNMPLATAVMLHYLFPVFTAILVSVFLGEKLYKPQWFFFALCLAGIFMIKGFDTRVTVTGMGVAILGAFFTACAYTCVRKLAGTDHPLVIIFYFPFIAFPITGILSYFQWVQPLGWDWLFLLLIGVLTQIAQVYMTKAYQAEKASKVASVNYVGIIYALGFGYLFFNELFNWKVYIGMGLLLVGVLLNVSFKKPKEKVQKEVVR
ncbi:DMT family transporter [Rapidithrix thailandica]|uniref:DMT family transporter n=1 Tax=Rapidithrix thailandica TaxID=413964 RepID=A0AAW9S9C4_9BACT